MKPLYECILCLALWVGGRNEKADAVFCTERLTSATLYFV